MLGREGGGRGERRGGGGGGPGVRASGVRAFIIPRPPRAAERTGSKTVPREARHEAGCERSGWRKRIPTVPQRLHQGETPAVGRPTDCGGRKHRSGRIAWYRRWVTASKGATRCLLRGSRALHPSGSF